MSRGFEIVKKEHRKNRETVIGGGKKVEIMYDIETPKRADAGSAGYDFYAPKDIILNPAQKMIIWTDVKAYMKDDEILQIYPRSSMGIKKGLMLSNTVGIIDASYYENEDNDGNIGLPLLNTSGVGIKIKAGDRIAQGIFQKYLVADKDKPMEESRKGGMGSSGE